VSLGAPVEHIRISQVQEERSCDVAITNDTTLFVAPTACAAERHFHDTDMQNTLGYKNILGLVESAPQKRPSYWKEMLGGTTD